MLNKAILMGRLTRDPELRYTQSNIPVVTFSIAVDRNYSNNGGDRQTDFIDIVAWRRTAEFVSQWFTKGSGQHPVQTLARQERQQPHINRSCRRRGTVWRVQAFP